METNFSDRANFTTRLSSFLYDKIKKWSRRTKEERGMEEEEKRETKEKKKTEKKGNRRRGNSKKTPILLNLRYGRRSREFKQSECVLLLMKLLNSDSRL